MQRTENGEQETAITSTPNNAKDVQPSLLQIELRDWFAGQALQGMIIDTPDTDLAAHAYALADAMLAEREKRNG